MKLYRDADGKWVGTQIQAGNKNAIEVPTDKPGLLEWLNDNARSVEADQPAASAPDVPSGGDRGPCPRCKLSGKAAEMFASHIKIELMAERILHGSRSEVLHLTNALIERQQDFVEKHS